MNRNFMATSGKRFNLDWQITEGIAYMQASGDFDLGVWTSTLNDFLSSSGYTDNMPIIYDTKHMHRRPTEWDTILGMGLFLQSKSSEQRKKWRIAVVSDDPGMSDVTNFMAFAASEHPDLDRLDLELRCFPSVELARRWIDSIAVASHMPINA